MQWVASTIGENYALDFDGTAQRVNIPSVGDLFESTNLSVEAWIYPESTGTTNTILASENAFGFAFYLDGPNIFVSKVGQDTDFIGGGGIQAGEWTHVAITYDDVSETLRYYINGEFHGQSNYDMYTGAGSGNGAYSIGARAGSSDYSDETIDELRIWDRILSDEEIQDKYNQERFGDETGLIAYYDFQDGPGSSVVTDRTANANHGTLVSMDPNTDWVAGPSLESASNIPSSPSGLITTEVSGSQIDLLWTDNSSDETDFAIFQI